MEIVGWWKKLAIRYPKEVIFNESIGKSHEGRNIPAVVITSAPDDAKVIYMQCLVHASKSDTNMENKNVTLKNKYSTITYIVHRGMDLWISLYVHC